MKITTIVREEQDRAALVLNLPVSWNNSNNSFKSEMAVDSTQSNSFPASLEQSRYYLDITLAIAILYENTDKLKRPTGIMKAWTNLKIDKSSRITHPLFLTVRKILAGGLEQLNALRELSEIVFRIVEKGDGALIEPALVAESRANVRTPVPDTPLYIVCHSNNPIPWRRQIKGEAARHFSQIPCIRIRTINSLLGQNEPLYLPPESQLTMGCELGFVIGAEARNVDAKHAYEHVVGYVCTNDCYSGFFSNILDSQDNESYVFTSSIQTGDKSTDGCGPVGPWIVTQEEVGDPHNLEVRTFQDGILRDRAFTGSYLVGVEEMVEKLSHLITLKTGTIISLGAAGWDGIPDHPLNKGTGKSLLEVEVEKVGILRTPVIYPEANEQEHRKGRSPFFYAGTFGSSSPYKRLQADQSIFTSVKQSMPSTSTNPKGFWKLLGNQNKAEQFEIEKLCSPNFPIPVPFPVNSLMLPNSASDNQIQIVIVPKDTNRISISCQLAFIIGPNFAYAESKTSALQHVAGYAALLAIHNSALLDRLELPVTNFEQRWANYLGYWGDAQNVMGAAVLDSFSKPREVHFSVNERKQNTSTSVYLFNSVDTITHLSKAVTLLPGDVISLGPMGKIVEFSNEELVKSVDIELHIEKLPLLRVRISKSIQAGDGEGTVYSEGRSPNSR